MNALLLTGTIDTSVFMNTSVKVINTEERLQQYKTTLEKYILNSPFQKIVFAENSGYKFEYTIFEKLANDCGKQFEYIYIKTDIEKTIKLGKSYGEAILIEKAILNSKLLQDQDYIYKCTGRVYIDNIDLLVKKTHNSNEFIAYNNINYCFTLFFKISRKDFLNYFIGLADLCDEKKGKPIENVYYDVTINNNVTSKAFVRYPRFDGICGTDGNSYGCSGIRLMVKNVLLFSGEYSINPKKGIVMDLFFRLLGMGPKYEKK